jgi:hypothetical protein
MAGKSHASVVATAARVADEHLTHALAALHDAPALGSGTLPDARRHIRKVKVLMRLIDPWLEDGGAAEARRRLRALNRRLAPLADGADALRTMAHLAARERESPARPAITTIHRALVRRSDRNIAAAAVRRLLQRSEAAIAVERARIGTWTAKERHRNARTTTFAHGIREAADAIATALERPLDRDRAWRRRATELWVRLRLLEGSRGELHALRPVVEAMEASLEEAHNVTVLEKILTAEGLGSRGDTAAVLRVLRRYQREVRARAVARGKAALVSLAGRTDDHDRVTSTSRRGRRRVAEGRDPGGFVPVRRDAARAGAGGSARRVRHRVAAVRHPERTPHGAR